MLAVNLVLIGSCLTAGVAIVSVVVSAFVSIKITNRSVEAARKQWQDQQVLNSRIRKSEYVRSAYEMLAAVSIELAELTYAGWEESADEGVIKYRESTLSRARDSLRLLRSLQGKVLIETPGDEVEKSFKSLISDVELFIMFVTGVTDWGESEEEELRERGMQISKSADRLLSETRTNLMLLESPEV